MSNEDDQPQEPSFLRPLVEAIDYKPGWMFDLRWNPGEFGQKVLQLSVVSWTTDSFDFTKQRQIQHLFLVPMASYTRNTWAAWIFDRVRDIETHEAGEFFRINNVREFAPHHSDGEDPYRVWFVSDWATADKSSGEK